MSVRVADKGLKVACFVILNGRPARAANKGLSTAENGSSSQARRDGKRRAGEEWELMHGERRPRRENIGNGSIGCTICQYKLSILKQNGLWKAEAEGMKVSGKNRGESRAIANG